MLRDICIDGRLAYRALGFLVRDDVWNTVPVTVEPFRLEQDADTLRVRLQLGCRGFGLDVGATMDVTLDDGRLRLAVEAVVNTDGRFNRIGLVALHPMPESAGARYRIDHCDGTVGDGAFAEAVGTSPVFRSVRAIAHEIAPGVWCRCAFDDEAFETEDQRVFSDASLKTYSRSNALPRPMVLSAGECIRQAAVVTWTGPVSRRPRPSDVVTVSVGEASGSAMPPIGIMVGRGPLPDTDLAKVVRVCGARFVLCRVDRHCDRTRAERIADALKRSACPIVLEIDETAESAASLIEEAASIFGGGAIAQVRLSPFAADLAQLARARFGNAAIGAASPNGLIGLLRGDPPLAADFVAFATCAIVHDADPKAVMETTLSLPVMLQAARRRYHAPVNLGPSTIALVRHPHAAAPVDAPPGAAWPMAAASPLMDQRFAAAWTAAFVAEAARLSESICLFTTHGPNGLVDSGGTRRPPQAVFAALACLAGRRLLVTTNSDATRVACLAVREEETDILILANRTGDSVRVAPPAEGVAMRSLANPSGEHRAWAAWPRDDLRLDGYDIVMLRWRHQAANGDFPADVGAKPHGQ